MLPAGSMHRVTGMVVVVVAVLLASACTAPTNGDAVNDALPLVPRPVSAGEPDGYPPFTVTTSTHIVMGSPDAEFAAQELSRYIEQSTGLTLPVTSERGPEGVHAGDIVLAVAAGRGPAGYEAEGYRLGVGPHGVSIDADTATGVYWGIQTLRQLLPVSAAGEGDGGRSIPAMTIEDYPRYAYRGLMLDVARHFFDVDEVKRVIDDMASLKLNHLHLHLTDDQGWRIEIPSWPKLATVGGQTAVGGDPGGYYTTADYEEIVAYASARHITVVPEIDLPGHTNAALVAYPELGCGDDTYEPYTGIRVGFSSVCVDSETTYRFIDDVMRTLAELTPGPYLHIGGDEALELKDADYLTFIERAAAIAAATGKTVVGWHEMGKSPSLPKGTVGQYWDFTIPRGGAAEEARSFVEQGGRLILSPADAIYLDMKYDPSTELGQDWAGTTSLEDAYGWDPDHVIPEVSADAVLGVEAALWTETVRTRKDLESLVFPRIAAAAEIAWSPAPDGAKRDFADFVARLGAVGARWAAAGIHFTAVEGVPWQRVGEPDPVG